METTRLTSSRDLSVWTANLCPLVSGLFCVSGWSNCWDRKCQVALSQRQQQQHQSRRLGKIVAITEASHDMVGLGLVMLYQAWQYLLMLQLWCCWHIVTFRDPNQTFAIWWLIKEATRFQVTEIGILFPLNNNAMTGHCSSDAADMLCPLETQTRLFPCGDWSRRLNVPDKRDRQFVSAQTMLWQDMTGHSMHLPSSPQIGNMLTLLSRVIPYVLAGGASYTFGTKTTEELTADAVGFNLEQSNFCVVFGQWWRFLWSC